jgi:hypothetical protein
MRLSLTVTTRFSAESINQYKPTRQCVQELPCFHGNQAFGYLRVAIDEQLDGRRAVLACSASSNEMAFDAFRAIHLVALPCAYRHLGLLGTTIGSDRCGLNPTAPTPKLAHKEAT